MKEIKIVTAYFDIGRKNRSFEKYLSSFKTWAPIKNDVYIYCEYSKSEAIKKVREDYGLKDKTHIIILDNPFSLESEIYKKMIVINGSSYRKLVPHLNYDSASMNPADYSYITFMKFWCLRDAANKITEDCNLAWIDFGYNHGDDFYLRSEDFNFLWEWNFSEDKIDIYCHRNPFDISFAYLLETHSDCVFANTFIVPKNFTSMIYEKLKEILIRILNIGYYCTEELLLVLYIQESPELFHIEQRNWFDRFMVCSNHHFSTRAVQWGFNVN